jgi:hypothetical protein
MKNQFLTLALATLVITGTAITSSASVKQGGSPDCKSLPNLKNGRGEITAFLSNQPGQKNQQTSRTQQLASAKGRGAQ